MNQDRVTALYPALIAIAPKCSVALFRRDIPIDLIGTHGWDISACALQALFKADAAVAKATVSNNCSQIVKQLNHFSAYSLEDDGCIRFLQLTQQCAPDIWEEITAQVDPRRFTHSLDSYSTNQRKRKGKEKRLQQLTAMFPDKHH